MTGYREEFFYSEGGETLEQVFPERWVCPVPRNVQDQVGQGSEQPDLIEDVTAHFRGIGLDDV